MKLSEVVTTIINPAMEWFPAEWDTKSARQMLLAIGRQESRFEHRWQVLNDPTKKGPARGFWQFELGGATKGVMNHQATRKRLRQICVARKVEFWPEDVWKAFEQDDVLACCAARLLLWTDPREMPASDDADYAWTYYMRNWRPGKPHRSTWNAFYEEARVEVYGP